MLQVPKWQGELLFSKEVLVFVGVILLILVGTLFCFWGYKYFRTVLFLGISVVICYGSYLLVEPMTTNLVVRMFLTVSLTFLGVCIIYFFDIIFCYILDKLRIRDALGKRSYILSAFLGAAILGLTIYFFIWRDELTVSVFSAVCLIIGLIFQHFKRKKQVRFRSYNDLIRMKRPKLEEDGLEILPVGMAGAAALAPVASVLAVPEPEPVSVMPEETRAVSEPGAEHEVMAESEPISVMPVVSEALEAVSEPEPIREPDFRAEFEPEPMFVMNARLQALSEIESEFAAGSEYERSGQPVTGYDEGVTEEPMVEESVTEESVVKESVVEESIVEESIVEEPVVEKSVIEESVVEESMIEEPVTEELVIEETVTPMSELENTVKRIVESAAEAGPVPIAIISNEQERGAVPLEISDTIKELLLRKMESDEELLEEAFFVKQISKQMAQKRDGAKKNVEEKNRPVYPGRISIVGKDRKSRRKREEGITKAAAIAAAGLGAFIVGRISKGGD